MLRCAVLCRHCPILDIMLRGSERGVGMCTDVALYAMHAGARIIPMPKGELRRLGFSAKAQTVQELYCKAITVRQLGVHPSCSNGAVYKRCAVTCSACLSCLLANT